MDPRTQDQGSEDIIEIEGTTLEGGGQLVRLTVGLSALTGKSIRIKNVRGGRGGGGGLKNQHLVSVQYLAQATAAWTDGATLKSRELFFVPNSESSPDAQRFYEHPTKLSDGSPARRVTIGMDSNGAVSLVLQAVFPYLLFATSSSDLARTLPIVLTLKGGTHVFSSPTVSYVEHVFVHNLSRLFPCTPPLIAISKQHKSLRGWTSGRATAGEVSFLINPLETGTKLPSFSAGRRGVVKKILISLIAPVEGGELLRKAILRSTQWKFRDVADIAFIEDEDSRSAQRYYLLLIAETEEGFRLGRDHVFSGGIGNGRRGTTTRETVVETLVDRCVRQLSEELQTGLVLDRRMIDQIAVFAGLAEGRSTLSDDLENATARERGDLGDNPQTSMHAITARWALERIIGADFEEDGSCHGAGLVAGQQTWEPCQSKSKDQVMQKYAKYQDQKDEKRRQHEKEAENIDEHLRDLHLQGKMPQW